MFVQRNNRNYFYRKYLEELWGAVISKKRNKLANILLERFQKLAKQRLYLRNRLFRNRFYWSLRLNESVNLLGQVHSQFNKEVYKVGIPLKLVTVKDVLNNLHLVLGDIILSKDNTGLITKNVDLLLKFSFKPSILRHTTYNSFVTQFNIIGQISKLDYISTYERIDKFFQLTTKPFNRMVKRFKLNEKAAIKFKKFLYYYGFFKPKHFFKARRTLTLFLQSNFHMLLEFRLPILLQRAGLFVSYYFAQSFVKRGNVYVNNALCTYVHIALSVGDFITINKKWHVSIQRHILNRLRLQTMFVNMPKYLFVSYKLLFIILFCRPSFNQLNKPFGFVI